MRKAIATIPGKAEIRKKISNLEISKMLEAKRLNKIKSEAPEDPDEIEVRLAALEEKAGVTEQDREAVRAKLKRER